MNKKGKTTIVFTLIIALLTVSLTVSGNINREYTLSNPNADKTATAVYGYLTSLYGKQVLSAQQESTWMGSDNYEFDYIQSASSKLPAIRGFDYMNDDFEGVNKIIDGRLNELGMEKEELLNSFTENYVIPNWQVIDTFK